MEELNEKKRLFKEGDEVAHKENIENKLEVRRIIKRKHKPKEAGQPERNFTIGIECGWWVGNEYKVQVFRTNTLVPWDIAQEGYVAVIRYIDMIQGVASKQ